jgi:hypothetical protein
MRGGVTKGLQGYDTFRVRFTLRLTLDEPEVTVPVTVRV